MHVNSEGSYVVSPIFFTLFFPSYSSCLHILYSYLIGHGVVILNFIYLVQA